MMTPKEKAKEIITKLNNIPSEDPCFIMSVSQCKKSALILIEEILQEVPTDILDTYKGETNFVDNDRYLFWQNVKIELEHL